MLTCEPTCPTLADARTTQRADAFFFEQHPEADQFVRNASWAERTVLVASGMSSDAARAARVRVVQVWPGFRLRQPVTPVVKG